MNCPCCGKKISQKDLNTPYVNRRGRLLPGVYQHSRCGAVLGQCYRGDVYDIYIPQWAPADTPVENQRYFDLTVLGSAGIERVHGWFDVKTRKLTQVG